MKKNCSSIKLPKISDCCEQPLVRPLIEAVYFNKKTKEVRNEFGEFIGFGEMIKGILKVNRVIKCGSKLTN